MTAITKFLNLRQVSHNLRAIEYCTSFGVIVQNVMYIMINGISWHHEPMRELSFVEEILYS